MSTVQSMSVCLLREFMARAQRSVLRNLRPTVLLSRFLHIATLDTLTQNIYRTADSSKLKHNTRYNSLIHGRCSHFATLDTLH